VFTVVSQWLWFPLLLWLVLAHGCTEKIGAALLAESRFADCCRCVTGKLRWLVFARVSQGSCGVVQIPTTRLRGGGALVVARHSTGSRDGGGASLLQLGSGRRGWNAACV